MDFITALANSIVNILWTTVVKNATNFLSNAINPLLPYIAGVIALVILFILLLNLF